MKNKYKFKFKQEYTSKLKWISKDLFQQLDQLSNTPDPILLSSRMWKLKLNHLSLNLNGMIVLLTTHIRSLDQKYFKENWMLNLITNRLLKKNYRSNMKSLSKVRSLKNTDPLPKKGRRNFLRMKLLLTTRISKKNMKIEAMRLSN